jgi:hypothetical protein
MTDQHPITPPPELVQQWLCSDDYLWGPLEQKSITITANRLQNVATQAAQWGSDQELEACCKWLFESAYPHKVASVYLRTTRRPKPPSLKEQALAALGPEPQPKIGHSWDTTLNCRAIERHRLVRRALEALDD